MLISGWALVSSQNCTLHQSEGRRYLESVGLSSGGSVATSCLPLLSANSLNSTFGSTSPDMTLIAGLAQLSPQGMTEELADTCVVTGKGSSGELDSMRCSLRQAPAYQEVSGQSIAPANVPNWSGKVQWRSFSRDNSNFVRIEAQRTGFTNVWAQCEFTLSSPFSGVGDERFVTAANRGGSGVLGILLNLK